MRPTRAVALVNAVLLVALAALPNFIPTAASAEPNDINAAAVPRANCGPGSDPETDLQGRVSPEEVASGRAARGYRCNTEVVSHFGTNGGYRVYRYVDHAGHTCAFFDPTLLFPGNAASDTHKTGVVVLDMSDPAKPVETARLVTPAMQTPHESLSLHAARGLLAADLGNPETAVGHLDLYSVADDCRNPALLSSAPMSALGHEGGFSPDGMTFWSSSITGGLGAIDVSDPTLPKPLFQRVGVKPHGLNVSDDGKTLFYADLSGQTGTASSPPIDGIQGLSILDVSEIQTRATNPQTPVVSRLTWASVAAPQTAIPVTIKGHPYLVEVDEFANHNGTLSSAGDAVVGGGRIIDIADPRAPVQVSNFKLEVNTPEHRPQLVNDAGMSSALQGYAAHYCAVPQRVEPGIAACTFIASGLRIFDIRDPLQPREIAYFNAPVLPGGSNYAMAAPAFDPDHNQIWYSDGNNGFWALRITNGAWPFRAASQAGSAAAATAAGTSGGTAANARRSTRAARIPATGGPSRVVVTLSTLLLLIGLAVRRLTLAARA